MANTTWQLLLREERIGSHPGRILALCMGYSISIIYLCTSFERWVYPVGIIYIVIVIIILQIAISLLNIINEVNR